MIVTSPIADVADDAAEPPRRIVLDVVVEDDAWSDLVDVDALVASVARIIARADDIDVPSDASATVCFADDAAVRVLNAQFRNKDAPTNVLSFPNEAQPLGDIILARETMLREASAAGIAPADHTLHLVLHGVLHLLGFDHETPADADLMEALETRLLASLGIADPYAT